jgi:hypothetical protein
MGAWLFFVLALYGAVRYYRDASWKNFAIATAAVAIGLLWKEYSVIAGIFFGLVLFFESTRTWKEKCARIGVLALSSALALGSMALIVYTKYHYTYLDWLREAAAVGGDQSQHTFYFIAKSLVGVFLLGWVLVLVGFYNLRTLSRRDQWTLALLFPPSMLFLLWTFVSSRLYYVLAPLLTILALHGLRSLSRRRSIQIVLVVIILLGDYMWLFASGTFRVFLQ